MASDGQSVERLREFLRNLKPESRAMLIAELERAMLRGEDLAGGELVLQELRRTIRMASQPVPRIGHAARLFFAPLEPFLIDDAADHNRIGRIARVSLEPIWEWIGRDLMPAEAGALCEDVNRALAADNHAKAEQLTRALHERAIQRMQDAIAAAGSNDKQRRRLAVQVGTPRALDDVSTILRILKIRDVLADLAHRLPSHLRSFERDQVHGVKTLIDGAAGQRTDVVLFALVLVLNRLVVPWQLIRLATHAAESDDTARVAETPYAAAVTIVLGEMESMVGELRADLKRGLSVTALLKSLHDAARGLRTEMDLAVETPWGRKLAAIRTDISNVLKTEIESTPGRVRRLLRPRSEREIVPGSLLDAIDVGEAEVLVEFVGACRNYASELAVNEVTMRNYSELQQYLDTRTKTLLENLRHSGDADRPFRQSQVDAAIRFCKKVFGPEYAGLLAKAAEVAVLGVAGDRKALRA
jgi:hypothetical protein